MEQGEARLRDEQARQDGGESVSVPTKVAAPD